ncbi:MAG: class II aldolase/adducin family protein [Treponema sp.]|jgi:rhamnose utilization protein RhaD (predicted bifunctional aldolase and dehydrogenase)|nr:class II aldolase/adducin family protein [Treponema sp.]
MGLSELAALSRFYGSGEEYVIAGGGNTSFKDDEYLYIKGSGVSLAVIDEGGFVKMDRSKLADIWTKAYGGGDEAREAAVLSDMLAARCPGEEHKRPSVEVQLHDLLPFAYVVHTHPALVNGLTCSRDGEEAALKLFDAVWIPSTNPGYILSLAVKDAVASYRAEKGREARIIFLQNHGVFAAADTAGEIKLIYDKIMDTLKGRIKRKADLSPAAVSGGSAAAADPGEAGALLCGLARQAGEASGVDYRFVFLRNPEIAGLVKDRAAFYPVSRAYTPDQIVYAGSDPLFIENINAAEGAWKKHLERTGRPPKVAALRGLGVFALGPSEKTAADAAALFLDTVKIAAFTESFGGPRFMEQDKVDFINNWEAEHYRSKVAAGK